MLSFGSVVCEYDVLINVCVFRDVERGINLVVWHISRELRKTVNVALLANSLLVNVVYIRHAQLLL